MSGLAEEEVLDKPWVVWAKRGGIVLTLIVVGIGVLLLARELSSKASPQQKQIAKIHIVPDTPPPPPPPPKEEKRPEPKETKEAKVEPPKEPTPQEAEQLKMEGQGSDNGLAGVGAGTVLNEYNGQKLGDGSRFAWYKGVLQRHLQDALQGIVALRKKEYRVTVKLWLLPDGAVSRVELVGSTGNGDIDDKLRSGLATLPPLAERPPDGLPQPVTMRLTSRS
ncbi:MAG TPA: energy transducer TonB [Rhodocyclaceae bacterium]|nr:energy transducer TonB [Rhodocyclaceae bacterium]